MPVVHLNTHHKTHEVINQPPALTDYNVYSGDATLKEGVQREKAGWADERLSALGALAGSEHVIELGRLANSHLPELRTHDAAGRRIDEVLYHSAYHELMSIGMANEVHALPWNNPCKGAHVARAASHYLLSQAESGVGCPLTMTFAAVPALRHQPDVAAVWISRITSKTYDKRFMPPDGKKGCMMGMAMTEKQGGSDVRSNTTQAIPLGNGGPGAEYELSGHKWFCSAPMCDAFLTLAQTDGGLSCFLIPRWLPDGAKNHIFIQRLKDKLGNCSNASSEIEYDNAWAVMVGEEGRGVATIIEMVAHTRLDCVIGSSAIMRQAIMQAGHYARHRSAFGDTLRNHPLMKNVLADLAVESEAATVLMVRLASSYDDAGNADRRAFSRIATAISKYWVCKRGPQHAFEAMECLGGNGYVEESNLARLYRDAPVNSIWEGSGNVICLDVLRAMAREPQSVPALFAEIELAKGANYALDAHVAALKEEMKNLEDMQRRARCLVERLALALQGSLLVRFSPHCVSDAFCASRLGHDGSLQYGTLPVSADLDAIIDRALDCVG